MKKLISILMIVFLVSFFSGCNNLINDENGRIQDNDIAHKYIDGEYYIFSSKFDNESKAAYIALTVKNRIITNIDFNYIYQDGNLYINKENISNEITFYVNSLNTQVLQNQDSIKNTNQNFEEIFSDYSKLLAEGLNLAKEGTIKLSYINIDYTYSAKTSKYDKNGYDGELIVAYKNGLINSIFYTKRNSENEVVTSNNDFLRTFKDANNINYQKYIQNIIDMSIEKESIVLSTNNLDIDKEYNSLANKINEKSKDFDYTKYKIFNNIGENI
ncbi:hypothetical protein [Anaerofustis butyriciformans]|uniref:hypothetical protein n=1 Tax=Anaerofustis butyriciformans TaxID=3108533 RepID=UPI003F8AB197